MWLDIKKPSWSRLFLVCRNWMERDVDTSYLQWETVAKFETEQEAAQFLKAREVVK